MAISEEFRDAVEAGNDLRTKIMLTNYMLVDPTFALFDENLAFAKQSFPSLIAAHDGEELVYDISTWNKDYLDKEMTIVVDNFSNERIELLRSMCRALYGAKAEEIQRDQFIATHSKASGPSRKQIGTGVAIGGVVAAAVGLMVEQPILTIAGAAAVVAGGVLIFTDK